MVQIRTKLNLLASSRIRRSIKREREADHLKLRAEEDQVDSRNRSMTILLKMTAKMITKTPQNMTNGHGSIYMIKE